jgi:hypothetical protein
MTFVWEPSMGAREKTAVWEFPRTFIPILINISAAAFVL